MHAAYHLSRGTVGLTPNWYHLSTHMKGRLRSNPCISYRFNNALDKILPGEMQFQVLLEQLNDYTPPIEPTPTDGSPMDNDVLYASDLQTSGRSPEDGVCTSCLRSFIGERLPFWIEAKRLEGTSLQNN
jgi:hypothetical protein